jgi:hypothetical protein
LVVLRALVTSRTKEELNPTKALSIESSLTAFSYGLGTTFHSNTLPTEAFNLVYSPLFLFFNIFTIPLVLLSKY